MVEQAESTIGIRIKELRKSRKFSQRQVASSVGLDHSTVSRIERGQKKPFFDTAILLVSFLEPDPLKRLAFYEFDLPTFSPYTNALERLNDLERLKTAHPGQPYTRVHRVR